MIKTILGYRHSDPNEALSERGANVMERSSTCFDYLDVSFEGRWWLQTIFAGHILNMSQYIVCIDMYRLKAHYCCFSHQTTWHKNHPAHSSHGIPTHKPTNSDRKHDGIQHVHVSFFLSGDKPICGWFLLIWYSHMPLPSVTLKLTKYVSHEPE